MRNKAVMLSQEQVKKTVKRIEHNIEDRKVANKIFDLEKMRGFGMNVEELMRK